MSQRALAKHMVAYAFPEVLLLKENETIVSNGDSIVTLDNVDAVTKASYAQVQVLWFFAQWCGHCREMHAEWEKAVELGSDYANWHKVDCAGSGLTLAHSMEVKSFPTVIYLKMGDAQDYQGDRKAEAFVDFAQKLTT